MSSNQFAISDLRSLEDIHTSGVYPKRSPVIVRGEGARVWDSDGREYIDCVAGHGVANLGHCHPAVVQAVTEQANRLITCPEIFYNDQRAQLLARLSELAPSGLSRAFLCNSGAEAVEAAMKFARFATGRTQIVSTMRSFHGRTYGALSLTGQGKYRKQFEPLVPDVEHVPYNNLDALANSVSAHTAAVILEIVQGEGGVRPASNEYLLVAQELCRQHGALLIIDEVQTGLGRTGRLLACEHAGLEPDLLCLAKSLAGGLPMGATLFGEQVGELPTGAHASTFGGNPLACAAALATLDVLVSEALPQRAEQLGAELMAQLQQASLPVVREVRGLGLMIGLELKRKVTPILKALQERGVLALPAGATVLRLLPPLVIEAAELEIVADNIQEVLTAPG